VSVAIPEQPVVADALESGGQDVEEHAPHEFVGRERHGFLSMIAVAIVLLAKPHLPRLHVEKPGVGDGHAVRVADIVEYLLRAGEGRFACGRGHHEKTIAQLKSGLAFHTVPTMSYAANSAWQHLVVLAHNLLTNFQIETGAVWRTASRKRTALPQLETIQSLRFTFFNRAAQILRPHGAFRLRLMDNPETRRRYERVTRALARAT